VVEGDIAVDVSVTRDLDASVNAVKSFASTYNAAVDFYDQQRSSKGPLFANGSLRSMLSSMSSVMLTGVTGLCSSNPYSRAALVGVSLTKEGKLEVDASKLKDALTTNLRDVTALFGTSGTPTDADVAFVSGGSKAQAGSYAVDITAAATKASLTGAGFNGTYADDGSADTLTLTDAFSGKSGSVQLANGDSIDTIVGKLNTLFSAQGMGLTASKGGAGNTQLVVSATNYGSANSFTVAYTGGGADGSAQLGLAAGAYAGTDVAGTIGGLAATGTGQVLTGATGGATEGITLRYSGSTARAAGSLAYVLGVAGNMQRVADSLTRAGDGLITLQTDSIDRSIGKLTTRVKDAEHWLGLREEALTKQFLRMEEAMAKIQSQGSWLTSQITAMQSSAGASK